MLFQNAMHLFHRLALVPNSIKKSLQYFPSLLDFKMCSGEVTHNDLKVDNDFKVVFVLGPPGSGKGTICNIISPVGDFLIMKNIIYLSQYLYLNIFFQRYAFKHLSAGDLLREEMNQADSKIAEQIKKHMKMGSMVPVEITCRLLSNVSQGLLNKIRDSCLSSHYFHKLCFFIISLQAMEETRRTDGNTRFLVDGFPRNEDNKTGWEMFMGHVEICKVIVVDCSDEVSIKFFRISS